MGDVASCACLSKDDEPVDVPLKDIEAMPASDVKDGDPKVPRLALASLKEESDITMAATSLDQASETSGYDPMSSRTLSTLATKRNTVHRASAEAALSRLREGNIKFFAGVQSQQASSGLPGSSKAIALFSCCTPPPLPLEAIFDVEVGEIGCTVSASMTQCEVDDGSAAAIEFCLVTQHGVALVIVMETLRVDDTLDIARARVSTATQNLFRNSEYICTCVRRGIVFVHMALLDAGPVHRGQVQFLGEHPDQASFLLKRTSEEQTIVTFQPGPIGVSDEQGIVTKILNKSQAQEKKVKLGFKLIAVDSQKCSSFEDSALQSAMSGNKPYQVTFKVPDEMVQKIPVPAEEGLAMLMFGNRRAATKVINSSRHGVSPRSARGSEVGADYNPFALVYMSFDPHSGDAPLLEVMFDIDPTRIATIPTFARNKPGQKETEEVYEDEPDEVGRWEGYIHFTEHCLTVNSPRLLLVLGRASADSGTERELAKEQVFKEMCMLLERSKVVKAGVADGQLLLWGGVYLGKLQKPPGYVDWLGPHPRESELLDKMYYPGSSQLLSTKDLSSIDQLPQSPSDVAEKAIACVEALRAGNKRYVSNRQKVTVDWSREALSKYAETQTEPIAFVLSGAVGSTRAPERLFDTLPGELVVHRTCGAISGRRHACAMTGLEKLVETHAGVPLLIILGDVCDPVTSLAAAQAQRMVNPLKPANAQMVIDQFSPVMEQALRSVSPQEEFLQQQQQELLELGTCSHVLYVLERLLIDSDVIMDLVRAGRLEVWRGVVHENGSVEFFGGHPDLQRLIDQRERSKRHKRKGIGLGR